MSQILKRGVPVLFAAALIFFVLTVSIGLPIYCRPFYYAHIDALELERYSGFTSRQIRQAYDEVLDYLTLPNREFGTGDLAYSTEGAAHFADCKVLFNLNAGVMLGSGLILLAIVVLRRLGMVDSLRRAAFYAGAGAITLPLVVGGLAAVNFDRAFVIFHHIFFPGKDNWMFDYRTDQIILVLPQEFFRNCAILIGVGVLTLSVVLMWLGRRRK
jgi:integral membrane protein (TIGR01906 family)